MAWKTMFGIIAITLCLTTLAQAEDVKVRFSIQDAMVNPKIQAKLGDVKLYWGNQKHPKVVKNFGEFKTSNRTNAFMKGREEACQWALASGLIRLQERALKEGGNAVIDIRSNIKNREMSSATEYECLAGSMMVNVALKGTVVKLAN